MIKRLNTATLDELQNVICCSNYRRDYMSEINMYKWEDIRKYFPPERVAEIRAKILELRKYGKYTDRELWRMYGMSERTIYDLVERAKDGSTAENLKNLSLIHISEPTRLLSISYAVFCLKKKKKKQRKIKTSTYSVVKIRNKNTKKHKQ